MSFHASKLCVISCADIAQAYPMQRPYFGTNVTRDCRLTDHCDENLAVKVKVEALSLLPPDTILRFKETEVELRVSCSPYLGVFLNTLQVRFTNLEDFRLSCEAFGKELSFQLARIGQVNIKMCNRVPNFRLQK